MGLYFPEKEKPGYTCAHCGCAQYDHFECTELHLRIEEARSALEGKA